MFCRFSGVLLLSFSFESNGFYKDDCVLVAWSLCRSAKHSEHHKAPNVGGPLWLA